MKNRVKNEDIVCIGMPVYNGEKFIRDAINSLLSQSFAGFQLLISDNCSTDSTENICKEYVEKDSRVTYIRQPVNIGAAKNFIFVFNNRKKTKYFMWAACDDLWSDNWLETLVANFEENDCGLFGRYIEGDANFSSTPRIFLKNQFINFFLSKDISGKCYYSYALFKSAFLENSNFDLMNISLGADQIYLLNLLQFGNLRFVDNCLFYYRVHSDSEAVRQNHKYGALKRTVFSNYPLDYYSGAIRAVPRRHKISILCLIPVKYFYEQIPKWIMIIKRVIKIFHGYKII